MRPLLCFLSLACLTCGCVRLPSPPALTSRSDSSLLARCAAVFPAGDWQMVHALSFSGPAGAGGQLLGLLRREGDTLASALLTAEGLTLFAARQSGDLPLQINRAVPPFDNSAFAAGLFDDIRLLFSVPEEAAQAGQTSTGEPVCHDCAGEAEG